MRHLVLVTNDDGYLSTGLRAAAEAVLPLADVVIAAPEIQQTAMGRSFPRGEVQGIITARSEIIDNHAAVAYSIHGSPAQTVAHALLELVPRRPVLCVCGINDGENLGGTGLISGTIGAALEAAAFGIPAIAVSVGPERPDQFKSKYRRYDWAVADAVISRFVHLALRSQLPCYTQILNINIPWSATTSTEIRYTRQSRQPHYLCAFAGRRDHSMPFRLPVVQAIDWNSLETNSDLYAFFVDGVISVTPMVSDLTDDAVLAACTAKLRVNISDINW